MCVFVGECKCEGEKVREDKRYNRSIYKDTGYEGVEGGREGGREWREGGREGEGGSGGREGVEGGRERGKHMGR